MRQVLTVVAMCGLLLAGSVAARQKPPEVALQAAMRTETVSGDLKGAIAQYQEIVDQYSKTERAVAATALVGWRSAITSSASSRRPGCSNGC